MLSRLLVVGQGPEIGTQTLSYLLYLAAPPEPRHDQPEIASALWSGWNQASPPAERPVPPP
jgi:hypothetical protein